MKNTSIAAAGIRFLAALFSLMVVFPPFPRVDGAGHAAEQGNPGSNGADGKDDKDPGQAGGDGGSGSLAYTPGEFSLTDDRKVGGSGGKGGRGQAGTIFTGSAGVGGRGGHGGDGDATVQSGGILTQASGKTYSVGGSGGAGGYGGDGAIFFSGDNAGDGGAGGSGVFEAQGSGSATFNGSLRLGGDGGRGGNAGFSTIADGGDGGKGGVGGAGTLTVHSDAKASFFSSVQIGGTGGAGGTGGYGTSVAGDAKAGAAGGTGVFTGNGQTSFSGASLAVGGAGGRGGEGEVSAFAVGGHAAEGGAGGAGTVTISQGGTLDFTSVVVGGAGGDGGNGGYGTGTGGDAGAGSKGGDGSFAATGGGAFSVGNDFRVGGAGGRGGNGGVGTVAMGGYGAAGGAGGAGTVAIAAGGALDLNTVAVGGRGGDGGAGDGGAGAAGAGGAGGKGGDGSFAGTGGGLLSVGGEFRVGGDGGHSGDGGYGFFAGGGHGGQDGGAGGEGKVSLDRGGAFLGTVKIGGDGGDAGDGAGTFTGNAGEGGIGGTGGKGDLDIAGSASAVFHAAVQLGGHGGDGGAVGGAWIDVGKSGKGGKGGEGVLRHNDAEFRGNLSIGGDGGAAGSPLNQNAGTGGGGGSGQYTALGNSVLRGNLTVGGRGADGPNSISEGAAGGSGGSGGSGTVTFGGDTVVHNNLAIGNNGGWGGGTVDGSSKPSTGYGSGPSGSGGAGGSGTLTLGGNFQHYGAIQVGGHGNSGGRPGSTKHIDQIGGNAGSGGWGGSGKVTIDSTGVVVLDRITLGGNGGTGYNGGGNNGNIGGNGGDAGGGGSGTLTILNGTVSVGSLYMGGTTGGAGAGGKGSYQSGHPGRAARGGSGTLDIRGGTTTLDFLLLGGSDNYRKGWGGAGTLNLYGGSAILRGDAFVGYQILYGSGENQGTGTVKLAGGTLRLEDGGALYLGGEQGKVNLTGGTLSSTASADGHRIESETITIDSAATLAFDLAGADDTTVNLVLAGKVEGVPVGGGAIRVTGVAALPASGDLRFTLVDTDAAKYVANTGTLYFNNAATAYAPKRVDRYWYALATDQSALQLISKTNPGGNTAVTWYAGSGVWNEEAENWTGTVNGIDATTYLHKDDVHFTYPQVTGTTVTVQSAGVNPKTMTVRNSGQWTFTGGKLTVDETLSITGRAAVTLDLETRAKRLALDNATLNVAADGKVFFESANFGAGSRLGVALDVSADLPAITVARARDWSVDADAALDVQGYRLAPAVLFAATEGEFDASSLFDKITVAGIEVDGPLTTRRFLNGLTVTVDAADRKRIVAQSGGLAWYNGVTPGTDSYNAHGTFNVLTAFRLDEKLVDNTGGRGAYFGWDGKTLTKTGVGTLALTADNRYTGGTTINEGLIQFSRAGNFGSGKITLDGGGLQWAVGSTVDLSGRLNPLGAGGGTFDTNGNDVTLAGVLAGTGGLVKSGEGALTLTGVNTYAGGTTVNAGTLRIGSDDNLGGGTNTLAGGTLQLTGNAYAKGWTLAASGNNVIEAASGSVVLRGALTGAGGFAKTGGGVLILTGTNTYKGGTTVKAGTLRIGGDHNLGGGTNTLAGGALWLAGGTYAKGWTLDAGAQTLRATGQVELDGVLSGSGGLVKTGAGVLALNGTNTYAGGTTVKAGTLRIGADGNLGGGTNTLSGGTLQVAGGRYAKGWTLDAAGDNAIAVAKGGSAVLRGVLTGSGGFAKTGAGVLTLSGANTYAGGTTVKAGTLRIGSDGNLGGGTNTLAGGILHLTGNEYDKGWTLGAGTQTIHVASTGGAVVNGVLTGSGALVKTGAGTLTLTGMNDYRGGTTVGAGTLSGDASGLQGDIAIARGAVLEFDQSARGVYAGVVTGAGVLVKSGDGLLALTGANTYTGGTRIAEGTLAGNAVSLRGDIAIARDARALFDQDDDGIYAGTMGGAGMLVKTGAGILTLSGDNTYTGGTTVAAGTLRIGDGGTGGAIREDGDIRILRGAAVAFDRADDIEHGGILSGAGFLVKAGAGILTLSGANTYTGGTTVDEGRLRGDASSLQGDIVNNAVLEFRQPALWGTYRGNLSGTGDLFKTGAGVVELAGDVKQENIGIEQGFLAITPGYALTAANHMRVAGGAGLSLFSDPGAAPPVNAKTFTAESGAILNVNGYKAPGWHTVIHTTGGITEDFDLYVGGAKDPGPGLDRFLNVGHRIIGGKDLQIETSLVWNHADKAHGTFNIRFGSFFLLADLKDNLDPGAGDEYGWDGKSLTKTGAGTLHLAGDNTYTGGTTVREGLVNFRHDGNFGAGRITLDGGGLQWAAGTALDLSGRLEPLGARGGIFDTNGNDVTLASAITGRGSLTKTGAGTLTLSGANTYAGGTTVDGGMLSGSTYSLRGDIVNNAAVTFGQDAAGTYAGAMSGTGSLFKTGAGILALSGINTYTGGTTVEEGGLSGNASSIQGDIVNNAAVVFNQRGAGIYAGAMSGSGSLSKTGAGVLTLSGANTYEGPTNVLRGTLALAANSAISPHLRLSHGTTFDDRAGNDIHLSRLGVLGRADYLGNLDLSGGNAHFFLPPRGDAALRVDGTANIDDVVVDLDMVSKLRVAVLPEHRLTLIHSDGDLVGTPNNPELSGRLGFTRSWTAGLTTDANNLYAEITDVSASPQSKALSEGFLGGLALALRGSDLIAGAGMANALAAARDAETDVTTFGAFSGGKTRHETGSHVDVTGLSLATGLAWNADCLTLGAFFEYGDGSYDTYNSFVNAASIYGDGDTHYLGGGILGRLDFAVGETDTVYAEASGRAGGVRNTYDNDDAFLDYRAKYTSKPAYYGLHVGGGYVRSLTDRAALDVHGKYFWTRQEGDTVTLSTRESVAFKDVDSHRALLGARFSYAVNDYLSPYLDVAYEYEFSGKARATVFGHGIDAPSLRGGTGIGGIGMTVKPAPTRPITLDLSAQGLTGRKNGVTGNLQIAFSF